MNTFKYSLDANASAGRDCDSCHRTIRRRLGSLCYTCEHHRGRYGSVKLKKLPLKKYEWAAVFPLVWAYLKDRPPADDICKAALALMDPPNAPPKGQQRRSNPRYIFWRELLWRQQPEAKKLRTFKTDTRIVGKSRIAKQADSRRGCYSARDLLAVLLCVAIVTDEQPGRFPQDAPDIMRARALLDLWKRRPFKPRPGAKKSTSMVRAHDLPFSLTRGMAERIRQSRVSVYLLQTSRSIIRLRRQGEAAKAAQPNLEPPPTTVRTPQPLPSRFEELKARYGVVVTNS